MTVPLSLTALNSILIDSRDNSYKESLGLHKESLGSALIEMKISIINMNVILLENILKGVLGDG